MKLTGSSLALSWSSVLDPGAAGDQLAAGVAVADDGSIYLAGRTAEVIGVLPDAAEAIGDVDVWIPLQEDDVGSYYLSGVGRLRPFGRTRPVPARCTGTTGTPHRRAR